MTDDLKDEILWVIGVVLLLVLELYGWNEFVPWEGTDSFYDLGRLFYVSFLVPVAMILFVSARARLFVEGSSLQRLPSRMLAWFALIIAVCTLVTPVFLYARYLMYPVKDYFYTRNQQEETARHDAVYRAHFEYFGSRNLHNVKVAAIDCGLLLTNTGDVIRPLTDRGGEMSKGSVIGEYKVGQQVTVSMPSYATFKLLYRPILNRYCFVGTSLTSVDGLGLGPLPAIVN